MPRGHRQPLLVPLYQRCLVILSVAIQTAESTVGLPAAAGTASFRNVLAAVGTNVLVPEIEQVLFFGNGHCKQYVTNCSAALGARAKETREYRPQLPQTSTNRVQNPVELWISHQPSFLQADGVSRNGAARLKKAPARRESGRTKRFTCRGLENQSLGSILSPTPCYARAARQRMEHPQPFGKDRPPASRTARGFGAVKIAL